MSSSRFRTVMHWFLPTPGNVLFTLLVVFGLLWANNAGALPFLTSKITSTSTETIAYQGRLADVAGNPLEGVYSMTFRLYDAATGGTVLWEEEWNNVTVQNGLFNVMLGNTIPITPGVVTGNDTLHLGITVGLDEEMTPRVQLGSVPYALRAQQLISREVGASNKPLLNFVPTSAQEVLRLENQSDISLTPLDLTDYTSPTATNVLLWIMLHDSNGISTLVLSNEDGN